MGILDAVVGPVAKLLDKIIPDPQARDKAKLELLKLQGDQEMGSEAWASARRLAELLHDEYLATDPGAPPAG